MEEEDYYYQDEIGSLEYTIDHLEDKIDELEEENEKLKQALQEIKEIVEPIYEQIPDDKVLRQILLKISEVE